MESVQKSTKSDVILRDPKSFFESFGESCHHLRMLKEKKQKRNNINQQRTKIQKEIINTQKQKKFLCRTTLILALCTLGLVFSSNRQIQKTGIALAGTGLITNGAFVFLHSAYERKLRRKESFWDKKERELERS